MNPYAELGVSPNATMDEIKQAYRRLSREWHPDKAPAGKREQYEQKMKAINAAYTWLEQHHKTTADRVYERQGFKEEKDPFGFSGTHTQAGGAYNASWDFDFEAVKRAAEHMQEEMRNYRWSPRQRPCPHCHGTGWTEEVEPNF